MHFNTISQSQTLLFLVLSITLLVFSPFSLAGSKVLPIEGMKYTINTTLMDNLNALTGKKVTLTLDSGKILTGQIKSVGTHLVHLEKSSEKSFLML